MKTRSSLSDVRPTRRGIVPARLAWGLAYGLAGFSGLLLGAWFAPGRMP
jgi:hypothetical protein